MTSSESSADTSRTPSIEFLGSHVSKAVDLVLTVAPAETADGVPDQMTIRASFEVDERAKLVREATDGVPLDLVGAVTKAVVGNFDRKLSLINARREHLRQTGRLVRGA
jgi:broad specificity polyphosphatase/5'/3'-nucleotidase SurE